MWAADPVGHRWRCLERFGRDVEASGWRDVLESVLVVLREQAASDFGLLLGPVPPRPDWCRFHDDDGEEFEAGAFAAATRRWQKSLCGVDSVDAAGLDDWLMGVSDGVA